MALCQLLSVYCAGLFAGAAAYITFVEHPARMECGTLLAVAEFGPSYLRATVMQASLAAVSCIAALVGWRSTGDSKWLFGAVLIGAVIPFTLIVILPTNKKLLDPSLDRGSEEARRLLVKWGRLHAVRTVMGLVAFATLLSPAYGTYLKQGKEAVLKQDLFQLRSLISQYTLDKQKAPQSLEDLVSGGYMKQLPVDPMTGKADWTEEQWADRQEITSVHSSSTQVSSQGDGYNTW